MVAKDKLRSLVVVALVPLLVCCFSYQHTELPPSRMAEGSVCFQSCGDDFDCVSRCPGALKGDGRCPADSQPCVDDTRLTDSALTLIIFAAISGAVLFVGALVWSCEHNPCGPN
jgi:hypothetical protein